MSIRPGSPSAWLLASRPATLSAAIVPVLVGSAVAYFLEGFAPAPALAALLGAVWIQIGTNYANDVFDYKKGADTDERLGPTRAAQSGLLTPKQLYGGMMVSFALAALSGVYLTAIAGWPILAIGTASVVSGIAYTGGPYPLGYNGLGDLFVLVFFGFVAVCGTTFVQLLEVPTEALIASIPVGSLATAILVVNNIRDAETDVRCGKRTLAVRFGRSAARLEYVFLLFAAWLAPAYLGVTCSAVFFLPLATLPIGVSLVARVSRHTDGAILNRCLKQTAALLLVHGLLLASAFVLAA